MSALLSPDEKVFLSAKASLEQPIPGKGVLYLTDRRLFLVHKSGLISKKETALLDVRLDEVSYAKAEGAIRKALVVGVRGTGGQVLTYKVHVSSPASWSAQISNLRGGRPAAASPIPQTAPPPPPQANVVPAKFCSNCGQQLKPDVKFCSACGRPVT